LTLSDLCRHLKNYEEAEQLLMACYQQLEAPVSSTVPVDGDLHEYLEVFDYDEQHAEMMQGLVRLYDAWGKKAQAAEWRQRVQKRHRPARCRRSCRDGSASAAPALPSGDVLFVAPEMVVHYIEEYGYCPPAEFVAAVVRSPLPDTEEYQLLTEPFWRLHKGMIDCHAFARPLSSTAVSSALVGVVPFALGQLDGRRAQPRAATALFCRGAASPG
jgi:hypothetical protein